VLTSGLIVCAEEQLCFVDVVLATTQEHVLEGRRTSEGERLDVVTSSSRSVGARSKMSPGSPSGISRQSRF
jgi:hypothetical protein